MLSVGSDVHMEGFLKGFRRFRKCGNPNTSSRACAVAVQGKGSIPEFRRKPWEALRILVAL